MSIEKQPAVTYMNPRFHKDKLQFWRDSTAVENPGEPAEEEDESQDSNAPTPPAAEDANPKVLTPLSPGRRVPRLAFTESPLLKRKGKLIGVGRTQTDIVDYSDLSFRDILNEPIKVQRPRQAAEGVKVTESLIINAGYAIRSMHFFKDLSEPLLVYALDANELEDKGWPGTLAKERRVFVWLAHLLLIPRPELGVVVTDEMIEETEVDWERHKSLLLAPPIQSVEKLLEQLEELKDVRASDPTTLAWAIKINLELQDLDITTTAQREKVSMLHFFSKNQIVAIRNTMCYTSPAIYYFDKDACGPCAELIDKAGGWWERLGKREVQNKRSKHIGLPCGSRADAKEGLAGRIQRVDSGTCFMCSKQDERGIKGRNTIAGAAFQKIKDKVYDVVIDLADPKLNIHMKGVIDEISRITKANAPFDSQEVEERRQTRKKGLFSHSSVEDAKPIEMDDDPTTDDATDDDVNKPVGPVKEGDKRAEADDYLRTNRIAAGVGIRPPKRKAAQVHLMQPSIATDLGH